MAESMPLPTAEQIAQFNKLLDKMGSKKRFPALQTRLDAFNAPRPTANYAALAERTDSWSNSMTGIGTARDKTTATTFAADGCLSFGTLEELYHNDDVSARICDLLPETALREGFSLPDEPELVKDMNALGVASKFEEAWIFARLYGGAACILGCDGAPPTPATGGVKNMIVIDRWSLTPYSYYVDTNHPKYSLPQTYVFTRPLFAGFSGVTAGVQGGQEIHESRVITFPGARTSPRKKRANQYWDDSVLQRVYQVVQGYGLTWASIIHLLQDAAQGVYKMKDLWSMIASGQKDVVEQRMGMVDEMRSVARAIMMDADDEDFKREAYTFGGIAEIIDRCSERVASASGYPLTVLMGSSPAGMNATGNSDLELFYGKTQKQRTTELSPRIRLVGSRIKGETGEPKAPLKISYPPLWYPTAKEQADTRFLVAKTDDIYFQQGSLTGDEIRNSRFAIEGYSSDYSGVDANGKAVESPALQVAKLKPQISPGGDPKSSAQI